MENLNENLNLVKELQQQGHITSKTIAKSLTSVNRGDFTDQLPFTDWVFIKNTVILKFFKIAPRQLDINHALEPQVWTQECW